MKLAYEAYDRSGRRVSDVIEASDSSDATQLLRAQGLFATVLRPAGVERGSRASKGGGSVGSSGKRMKLLAMWARQLHVLVATGTPLVEALYSLERQAGDPGWKRTIASVRLQVESGESLADAVSQHPKHFDAITRALIAAGEASGKMPEMLDRIGTITRKQLAVRNRVIGAMVYPALLLTVAMNVLVTLLMFVLPRFSELFDTLDVPLPPSTAVLMSLSEWMWAYWWLLPFVPVVVIGGAVWWTRTPGGKRVIDGVMLSIPRIGGVVRSFATARIIRIMGMLLASSLPLLEVLELVRDATTNHHYRRLIENAIASVTRGEPVSVAFAEPRLIDTSVYEALRSGEASGKVGPLMLNLAEFLDEDNEVVIKSLTSIIEPIILLVLGALIGFVAISLFMPLFDLTAMTGAAG